jgi:hypothetical protein
MIVGHRGGQLVIVLQVDHQAQCRLMAEAWGNEVFERLPGWDVLSRAAAVHDEGWRAWEAAPQIDSAGQPEDFVDVDRREHVEIYRRGIEHARALDTCVGLLVSMHGRGLYEARLGLDGEPRPRAEMLPEVRRFLAEQDRAFERHSPRCGDLWDAYRLLQAWDLLSLYATWRSLAAGREGVLTAVPRHRGDVGVDIQLRPGGAETVILEPYPFSEAPTPLPVDARSIPGRRYSSAADLQRELSSAEPLSLEIVARPA